jgi:hypothetical protein
MSNTKMLKLLNIRWRMGLYLFWKLPGAWFMGVNVQSCNDQEAVVSLPYSWRSQNPFRSIYFAAQCAAGEFSTGILCLLALHGKPPVSMLVTKIEAEFFKKASHKILFTCSQGAEIQELIDRSIATGQAESIRAESVGRLPDGTIACRVWISWSFKAK